MQISKCFWVARTFVYSLLLRKIKFPGYIGKPLLIKGITSLSLGKKVRIFPGARIECHGSGKVVIEENVSIGQGLHLISEADLRIGKGTLISGNVLITNIDHDYTDINCPVIEQKHVIKPTIIGENCFIGYGAVIQAGTDLGQHCIVGANSVVKGRFPDFCVIAGAPAKVIKYFDHNFNTWIKGNYGNHNVNQ